MPKKKTEDKAPEEKKDTKEEVIEVTKSQLDDVLKTIKDQDEKINVLQGAVSRARLAQSEQKLGVNQEDTRPRGFLKRLHGKLIVGWRGADESPVVEENKIVFQNNQPVGEIMRGEYIALDEEKTIVCDMIDFIRSNDLEHFRIVDAEGDMLTIQFENPELPQSYKINKRFINP